MQYKIFIMCPIDLMVQDTKISRDIIQLQESSAKKTKFENDSSKKNCYLKFKIRKPVQSFAELFQLKAISERKQLYSHGLEQWNSPTVQVKDHLSHNLKVIFISRLCKLHLFKFSILALMLKF